jgi:hypothetical protein
VQQLERLPVDEAAKRMCVFGHAAREKRADLVHQPAVELFVYAAGDALGSQRGRNSQPDRVDVAEIERRHRFGEVRSQRAPRQEVDLERANQSHPIARLNAARGLGIDATHHPPQPLHAASRGDRIQAHA